MKLLVQIHPDDNVAVAPQPIAAGTRDDSGMVLGAIPAGHKAALLPYFQNEAALKKTMADAVALTNYLRDYIWSIGIDRMRSAGASEGVPQRVPQQPQPTTPPAPATLETRLR